MLAIVLLAKAAGMFVSDFFYVKYYKKNLFYLDMNYTVSWQSFF